MSEELKPCPFCGGPANVVITRWNNIDGKVDETSRIDCQTHNMLISPKEWNTRVPEDAIRAELEEQHETYAQEVAHLYADRDSLREQLQNTLEFVETLRAEIVRTGQELWKTNQENVRLTEARDSLKSVVLQYEKENDALRVELAKGE